MAIIFLIGASCPYDGYVGHLKAIQEKVPYKLWVGLPHIVGDTPIPEGIGYYIDNMKSDLKENHGVNLTKYIYGGHSLGASSIASWVQDNGDDALATFLWGAYVTHAVDDPAKNYRSPVLTVGGEFDGWMARITRMAQAYDQMLSSSLGATEARYRYPVVNIEGLNHATFLSGIPPPTVQKTDLRASISLEDAIDKISDAVSSFIIVTQEGHDSAAAKDAKSILDEQIDETGKRLVPIIEMYAVEGAPFMSSFRNQTPWVQIAQEVVADAVMAKQNIKVTDEYKTEGVLTGDFEHSKPHIAQD
jgi:hypothetical protein